MRLLNTRCSYYTFYTFELISYGRIVKLLASVNLLSPCTFRLECSCVFLYSVSPENIFLSRALPFIILSGPPAQCCVLNYERVPARLKNAITMNICAKRVHVKFLPLAVAAWKTTRTSSITFIAWMHWRWAALLLSDINVYAFIIIFHGTMVCAAGVSNCVGCRRSFDVTKKNTNQTTANIPLGHPHMIQ